MADFPHRQLTKDEMRTRERVEEILRAVTERAEAFRYSGWHKMFLCTLITLFAIVFLVACWQVASPRSYAIAAIPVIWASTLWMRMVPLFSRPMISLTKDGVETALYGFIPWTAVEGVHASRGSDSIENALQLLVPTLPTLTAQMHPFARVLYRMGWSRRAREVLQFPVWHGGRRLDVVFGVAQALWEKRIGRKKPWFPDDPVFNERIQALDREMRRLDAIPTSDPEAALAAMQKSRAVFDDFQQWDAKRNKRDHQLIVVVLVLMIVAVGLMVYFKLQ